MRALPIRNDNTSPPQPHRMPATAALALLLGVLSGLALGACGKDTTTPPPGGRVFHATPDGVGSDCGSLQACLDAAGAGDTVELAAGRYTGVGDTLLPGSAGGGPIVTNAIVRSSGVTVRAARGELVRLDALGQTGRVGLTIPAGVTGTSLRGLRFENAWAGVRATGGAIQIEECTFAVGEHGLVADETTVSLRECRFEDHVAESILLRHCGGLLTGLEVMGSGTGLFSAAGQALSVDGSRFGPFCQAGLRIEEGGEATFTNCTVSGAGILAMDSTAVVVAGGARATLVRCIVANNRGYGVLCRDGGTAEVSCSDFFANSAGNYAGCADATGQRGNITLDPRFCGTLDFRLSADSPARLAACGLMGAYAGACGAAEAERAERE